MAPTAILQTGTTTSIVSSGTTTAIVITGAAATNGVQIEGTHAVADLRGISQPARKKRTLTFGIEFTGQISNIRRIQAHGQIQTESSITAESKIMTESEFETKFKMLRDHPLDAEGAYHSRTEAILPQYSSLLDENVKYLKMKNLIKTFKTIMEEED